MPQATDLMGVGMPNFQAEQLGNTYTKLTCLATSSQTGAAPTLSKNVELSAADSSHNSAILPSGALIGSPHYFFTTSSTSAIVYVPVGDSLNGSTNAGLTIAQNKGAIMWRYKIVAGVGSWASIVAA